MPVMHAGSFDDDLMWRGQRRALRQRARASGAEIVEA
jgi:hypothetical protein